MPKISVIVPIYNAEKYLHQCIDSIIAQTFSDFELLLIDDGSSDSSGFICQEYAQKDSRVRVFHKKNGGVSSARNLGIDNACGELITFCDSDDSVSKLYLMNLCGDINDSDFVVSLYNQNSREFNEIMLDYKNGEIGNYLQSITDFLTWSVPWGKIYRRTLLDEYKIRFHDKIHSGEDSIFVLEYLKYVKNILIKKSCGYSYTENNGLSSQFLKMEEIDLIISVLMHHFTCLEEKFNINLKKWKLNSIWNFITKYEIPGNFKTLYTDIGMLLEKQYMKLMVSDNEFVPKGIYRHMFDFLYNCKSCFLISIMVYKTKRFYR